MNTFNVLEPYQGKTAPDAPASVRAKQLLLLLLAEECITEEERIKMILSFNYFTQERAEKAIFNLQHRIKSYDRDNH